MQSFLILLSNHLLCIWRDKRFLVSNTVFALILVVAASLFFRRIGYSQTELLELTPGIIWLLFLFTGVVGLNQLFLEEKEDDAVQGLVLQVPDLGIIFLSKCTANIVFLCVTQFLIIAAHAVFFGVAIFHLLPELYLLVILSAIGFASSGTLLSAVSVCTRSREVMLPLLLYPLLLIPVAASASLTNDLFRLQSFPFSSIAFIVVCVFAVVSFVLSWLLFEYVVRG